MGDQFHAFDFQLFQHAAIAEIADDVAGDPHGRKNLDGAGRKPDILFQIDQRNGDQRGIGNGKQADINGVAGQRTVADGDI